MRTFCLFILVTLQSSLALAAGLDDLKKTCLELGFESGTKAYGECVITLVKREKKLLDVQSVAPQADTSAALQLQQQQMRQLQQQQIAIQKQMLEEAKRERQLKALGIAQQGLEFAFPRGDKNNTSSGTKNIWCGSYGVNTLCNAN
jgi:hypothetical protein